MNTDFIDPAVLFQLILEQTQQTQQLLAQVQQQNQRLQEIVGKQQALVSQQKQTIELYQAWLVWLQTRQQQAFGLVHSDRYQLGHVGRLTVSSQ